VQALTLLADLKPEVLAPGHTQPVFGAKKVNEVLTTTRDAILHVMHHTADGMNAGLSMDDMGWYDGNPTHLGTLSNKQRASHIAQLSGGVEALKQAAFETEDLQWRLELCDHLIALGEDVSLLKAEAMEALAEVEINATARNTYLWEAERLRKKSET